MTSDSPRATYETEISARFYLASYGPRSLKSLRRFREEVPQLSRPESRWCDVRSTRHRRIHGIGLSFTAELHSRASRPSSHTSRRTPSVFTLVGVHGSSVFTPARSRCNLDRAASTLQDLGVDEIRARPLRRCVEGLALLTELGERRLRVPEV